MTFPIFLGIMAIGLSMLGALFIHFGMTLPFLGWMGSHLGWMLPIGFTLIVYGKWPNWLYALGALIFTAIFFNWIIVL